LLGFSIIKLHGPQLEREALDNLAIIAKFKSTQIERWMDERKADSNVLAASSTEFVRAVGQIAKGDDPGGKHSEYVLGKLHSLRLNYHYSTLLLLDKDLTLLLAEGDQTEIAKELADVAVLAMTTGKVERTNLYKSDNRTIHLDWTVPIRNVNSDAQEVVAVVVLRTDPEQFLYPVIRGWPSVSESAESMLVRREGNDVLYLSELQGLSGTALALRLPLADRTLPASIALSANQSGSLRGTDYKKQDVLAAYHPVADTDWRIVSKISRDEVLVHLWQMVLIVSSVAFIFVIAISFGLLTLWRQQSRLQSLLTLAHKTRSERLLQQFFNMPFVGMAVISPVDKKLTKFNDYLCELIGYSREELIGKSCLDFTHPDDIEADVKEFNRIIDGHSSGYVMEKRFLRKDGSILIALVDTKCMRKSNGSVDYLYATAQDVTQQKAAEARIQRLTHLYAALSLCNQAIVRFTSEQAL
ncbi:MAG: PAS domain S-box protein, partial [Nitrosomonadales bacterium]|nr:PAS domain S-box protein [Nitrosomonadales bacterium]